ncbi:MAG: primase C-terminal domain-containing protein [Magnetococcales bacterium]|nr:primase C-terminal domain-containing protein [Magnetococcales bacterium]
MNNLVPNLQPANSFLSQLCHGSIITFQTFADGTQDNSSRLIRVMHGNLDQHAEELTRLNQSRAGIFFTVNETDGQGRKKGNITKVRAVFVDLDGAPLEPVQNAPLKPHIVVESSQGKYHAYWLVDSIRLEEFTLIQTALAQRFEGDSKVKDLPRVMRLPGFYHRKGEPFLVKVLDSIERNRYARSEFLEAFGINPDPEPFCNEASKAKSTSPHTDMISPAEILSGIPQGQRDEHLFKLACRYRKKGLSRSEVENIICNAAGKCNPPFPQNEALKKVKQAWGYSLNEPETVDITIEEALKTINSTLEAAKIDTGAPFEPKAIESLQAIKKHDHAQYMRIRHGLKESNRGILITELDKSVNQNGERIEDQGSIADAIVNIVKEEAFLFHEPDGTCYASFDQDGHTETWALESSGFKEWLSYRAYKEFDKAPREASLKDAIGTLSGIAKFDGAEIETWIRVAKHENTYYIDLCNDKWEAVAVTDSGWEVVSSPRVKFRRTKAMRPLPYPTQGGNFSLLWNSINIQKPEDQWMMIVCLLECFRPETPNPILEFGGEQGSGKSDTQSRIRDLIDPNDVNLRAAPREVGDIFVGAANNWIVSLNNLSRLSAPQQDAFCSLSTGGGFAGRQLYTNTEESVVEVKRPVMFNGISTLATAQDLVDRVVRFELPIIKQRRKSSELEAEFEKNRPEIFGGLLSLFSQCLATIPHVVIENLPRMADFAVLGEALHIGHGFAQGTFVNAYKERSEKAVVHALDASPVARAIQEFMDASSEAYSGTVKGLLDNIQNHKASGDAWPKSARGLSDALRRHAPGLRVAGITVEFDPQRHRDGVHVTISKDTISPDSRLISPSNVHNVHRQHQGPGG